VRPVRPAVFFVLAGVVAALGIVLLIVPAAMTHTGESGLVARALLRAGGLCWLGAAALAALGAARRGSNEP
jgi:hypothetical protein